MQNQSKKSLTFHSEEDIIRNNNTLTKLYRQLSQAGSDHEENKNNDSSLSDGIDQRYQEMLEESDANHGGVD